MDGLLLASTQITTTVCPHSLLVFPSTLLLYIHKINLNFETVNHKNNKNCHPRELSVIEYQQ